MLPGSEKNLSDYLATNVFQNQPAELQTFLLKTAPLGRFNAALCAHVCGMKNTAEILAGADGRQPIPDFLGCGR